MRTLDGINEQACRRTIRYLHTPLYESIMIENHPVSIQIPHKYKPHLRRLLSIEGLHLWDVFPDLDHIATGLKEEIFGTNPAVSPPENNKTN